MKLLIIPGSLREESFNKKIALMMQDLAKEIGLTTTFLDLKNYPMPILNQDDTAKKPLPESVEKFQKELIHHDVFLIITPEYNGSLPAVLKNAIDWASIERSCFKNKLALIMSASVSQYGGLRALIHLRQILTILGVSVFPQEKAIPFVDKLLADSQKINSLKQDFLKILNNLLKPLKDE